jgi:Fe-S-cluster formation regulator IscX/YfhJ
MEDWQTVVALGDEALAQGFSPGSPYEWLPLMEGYLLYERWEDARQIIQAAYDENPDIAPRLCRIVQRLSQASGLSENAQDELSEILNHDICQPLP